MFIFGIFLSALAVGVWVSSLKTAEMSIYSKNLEVNDLLMKVTDKINTVWVEGEGFSANLTMPSIVAGSSYDIQIAANTVVMTVSGENYIRSIITDNVTGSLEKGSENTLKNMGDHIEIS